MLKEKAKHIRIKTLKAIYDNKRGHLGGSFSVTEILVYLFYGGVMKLGEDKFILSKGHGCLPLYLILEDLKICEESDFKNEDGLYGHTIHTVPGIELTGGSLGHGLNVGVGMAKAVKMDGKKINVFVVLSDAECYEGTVWEAAFFAAHHNLDNLIVFVDRNRQGVLDYTENYLRQEPLEDKWKAFGWDVVRINGHSFEQIKTALDRTPKQKPLIIIADTVKGKGVSFMENQIKWHHHILEGGDYENAIAELERY